MDFLERHFDDEDLGRWEMRGGAQCSTHSRVMMQLAFNSGIRAVRNQG
ncbi:glycoside hydrolase family 15 protein [Arthrobacter sp. 35W]